MTKKEIKTIKLGCMSQGVSKKWWWNPANEKTYYQEISSDTKSFDTNYHSKRVKVKTIILRT